MIGRRQKRAKRVFTAQDVVTALYHGVLNREPDEKGLTSHCEALEKGSLSLRQLASIFHDSDERNSSHRDPNSLVDYTQFGELRHILSLLMVNGCEHPFVVDVGARGRDRSNSYNLLKDFGFAGLLIEANPELEESIRDSFSGLDFKFVNCAIGEREGKMPFYLGANPDVSSLLAEHAASWGALQGVLDVDVRRLHDVLNEFRVPNAFGVLSLDIEGLDVTVLNDLIENSDFRPTVIVVEASYDFKTKTLADAGFSDQVQSHYRLAAQTKANLILETYKN